VTVDSRPLQQQQDAGATTPAALQMKGNVRASVQTAVPMPDGLRRIMDMSITGSEMGLETF
jgi:hypothetical protein